MERLPDLLGLSHEQKDALIHALWAQVQPLRAQVEGLAPEITRLRSRVVDSSRREYRGRLESRLDAAMALAPTNRHGLRLRKRYGKLRRGVAPPFVDNPVASWLTVAVPPQEFCSRRPVIFAHRGEDGVAASQRADVDPR
jgi:hypothetical protein